MTRIYKRRREDALPTPRTTLRARYVRVLVCCNSLPPPGGRRPAGARAMRGAATCR